MNGRAPRQLDGENVLAWLVIGVLLVLAWLFAKLWHSLGLGVGAFVVFAIVFVVAREVRSRRKRKAPELKLEPYQNGLVLGQDTNTGDGVFLADEQLAAHGVILGAVGSGKTTTLLTILTDAIRRGLPVVALDLKGSHDFGKALSDVTHAAGRPFQFWRFDGPMVWNPLQYGDATELKDKLISTERFTEPHYQRAAERYLQTAIQVYKTARPEQPVTLRTVVSLLDPRRFQELLQHVPAEVARNVGPYVSSLSRDQQSAVSGLQSRLAIIADSTPGQWLQPANGRSVLDLREALCGGPQVVLFSLNASRYGKLAAQIAAMVIQDLVTIAGYRLEQPNRPQAIIAVDEFSSLEGDNVLALLNKSREAGISVLLATQEMTDLERLAPGFRDQTLGMVGTLIAHRQTLPASAELIAGMIGTQTVMKQTWQTGPAPAGVQILNATLAIRRSEPAKTGMGSMREVEEFRIHPNLIKDLPTGQAVLITKTPRAAARIVQVTPGPRSAGDHVD